MHLISLVITLVLVTSLVASADCKNPIFQRYLELDYKTFDQSPPDGGWRHLKGKGKDLEIAEIIDGYVRCRPGLTGAQKATLTFHAGQIFGDLGHTDLAVKKMKQARNSSLDKRYHWNSFVDGSIAFLEKDLEKLKLARDRVQTAEPDHPYVETLNDLIRCFYKPYREFENCRMELPRAQEKAPAVR